jgi:hypothetical protein
MTYAPAIDQLALQNVRGIEQRVKLMISYLQLYKHRIISRPLPQAAYINLLRDATPEQRVRLTIRLLEMQQQNPKMRLELPTELLVLAVYETADPSELVERLPWTESIRAAIEDIATSEDGHDTKRTIPLGLRIAKRVFGTTEDTNATSGLHFGAMLRLGKAPEILAALGNYRRLRAAGVIKHRMESELAVRILETVRDPADRISAADWAQRAGLLTATHFGRLVVRAIDEIDDADHLLHTQIWYLQMLQLGAVNVPLPAPQVAKSICHVLGTEQYGDFQQLMELLPEDLVDDVSIQAALETDVRNSSRTGTTAPHAAVPGALWQSIREVA